MAQRVRLATLLVVLHVKEQITLVVPTEDTTMEHRALRAMLLVRLAMLPVVLVVKEPMMPVVLVVEFTMVRLV